MNPESVTIDSINVSIGDLKVSLTPSQARKLYKVLDDIFSERSAAPVVVTPWFCDKSLFETSAVPPATWKTEIICNTNHEPWPNTWFMSGNSLQINGS